LIETSSIGPLFFCRFVCISSIGPEVCHHCSVILNFRNLNPSRAVMREQLWCTRIRCTLGAYTILGQLMARCPKATPHDLRSRADIIEADVSRARVRRHRVLGLATQASPSRATRRLE
jgi:hypothetical protein